MTGLKGRYCLDWWIKLLSAHGIDNYARVMYVIVRTGVRSESIIASLTHYSRESLPCFEQREIVEVIVILLLSDERGSIIPLSFLFGMLKIRITIDILTHRHPISYHHGHHNGSLLKVGRIMDAYLADIARDPYLSLQKFTAIIDSLLDYAHSLEEYRESEEEIRKDKMMTSQEEIKSTEEDNST
ncbi:hypothetical protein HID58_013368 [Brassica napus]|uniref:NPH3 domain-containing protein n=1 Tax=Brassica napus TaxID=3708 RepID=A0ABQ8E3P9_BRANA|nr:hypothetical protein HID58_013368 [Brassica napus]